MGLSCFGEGTGTSAGHLCDLFEYRTLSRRSGQRPSRWLHARDYQHADVFHQRPPLGGDSTLCRVSSCHRQASQTTTPFIVHSPAFPTCKVSVWVQGSSATPVSWSLQERRSCTWSAT